MYMYVCVPYFSRENASFARENTPYVCTASVVSREFKQIRFYVLLNHQLLTVQHILGGLAILRVASCLCAKTSKIYQMFQNQDKP